MSDTDRTREQGIDFGEVDARLSETEFPITASDLLADHGGAELETSRETKTLDDVLGEYRSDETFDSAFEAKQAVLTMVGGDAVGRRNYADRDPPTAGESTGHDSF